MRGREGGRGIPLHKLETPANWYVPAIEIEEALEQLLTRAHDDERREALAGLPRVSKAPQSTAAFVSVGAGSHPAQELGPRPGVPLGPRSTGPCGPGNASRPGAPWARPLRAALRAACR